MSGNRVLCVLGTRPEAIKMAPLVRRLAQDERFEERLLVTAQHRAMLDEVLEVFGLAPDHDLDLLKPGQSSNKLLARAVAGIDEVLELEQPDLVAVHGDTTTCLAGALAAFQREIPVAHVEAGLRTYDLSAPFPEEANRQLVGRLARLHLAPTESARRNLLEEGADPQQVHVTGNTVVDALLSVHARVARLPARAFRRVLGQELVDRLDAHPGPMVLVTGHRRESQGEGLSTVCDTLAELARAHPDWTLVWPVHQNPAVSRPVRERMRGIENVALVPPADYRAFVWLMGAARVIVTDSGGIQEEAPALGVPVLVTRGCTERPEAIESGVARLVGTDARLLRDSLEELLGDRAAWERMAHAAHPFGQGDAAPRCVEHMAQLLELGARTQSHAA